MEVEVAEERPVRVVDDLVRANAPLACEAVCLFAELVDDRGDDRRGDDADEQVAAEAAGAQASVMTIPTNATKIGHVVSRPSVTGVPSPWTTIPES